MNEPSPSIGRRKARRQRRAMSPPAARPPPLRPRPNQQRGHPTHGHAVGRREQGSANPSVAHAPTHVSSPPRANQHNRPCQCPPPPRLDGRRQTGDPARWRELGGHSRQECIKAWVGNLIARGRLPTKQFHRWEDARDQLARARADMMEPCHGQASRPSGDNSPRFRRQPERVCGRPHAPNRVAGYLAAAGWRLVAGAATWGDTGPITRVAPHVRDKREKTAARLGRSACRNPYYFQSRPKS